MHVKLAQVDQTFTAKYLGRGVIDTCTVVLVVLAVPVPVYRNLYRIPVLYIGITHVEFRECFFVSQHSSNVNLTQITNG